MIINPTYVSTDPDGYRWYAYKVHPYDWGFIHTLRREKGVTDDTFEYHSKLGGWRNTYTSTYGNVGSGTVEVDGYLTERLDTIAAAARRLVG